MAFEIDGHMFELCCQISIQQSRNQRSWKCDVYTHHSSHFDSFWYQSRKSVVAIHSKLPNQLYTNTNYLFVYVKCNDIDIKPYQNKYLRLIRGQSHVQCHVHCLPLVPCYKKENNVYVKREKQNSAAVNHHVPSAFSRSVMKSINASASPT
jgi:hypothetical protein